MRTTKTAKASIIRIAPPIVEEPSESLEPLKELFEKEETAYRLSFTQSMETRESTLPTGVSKSVLSVTSLLLIPLSNRPKYPMLFSGNAISPTSLSPEVPSTG